MSRHIGVLPSLARTSDTSVTLHNEGYNEAAHVVLDVTAGSGINLQVYVKGSDPTSGKAYTILTSSTVNTTGTTVLKIGPDYTAATNIAKDYMPYEFIIGVTQSGGISATYSIGASLI